MEALNRDLCKQMKKDKNRLFKNIFILYFRMILNMLMTFYVIRVVFNVLGVEDYGIYNVVGGVVMLFQLFNGAMGTAFQRFFSFELGKDKSQADYKKIFTHSIYINFIIILVVIILTETVGLWLLNNKLQIEVNRLNAANVVYQYAILSFVATIIYTPYYASIIAHEKMNIFGLISILEVVLKFLSTILLANIDTDKLILYSQLSFGIIIVISTINIIYCLAKFKECRFKVCIDKPLFKSMSSFVFFTAINKIAWVAQGQGINIVLNIFFGSIINAARGIAYQVNNAVSSFINNYRTAFNPQLIKLAANLSENKAEFVRYAFNSSKYTYLLLLILIIPLIMETRFVLDLWIGNHPSETDLFTQIVLITTQIQCFEASFIVVFQALGTIRKIYTYSSVIYVLVLPISYLLFKFYNMPPETAFYMITVTTTFVVLYNFKALHSSILRIKYYTILKDLLLPLLLVTLIALIPINILNIIMKESFYKLVAIVLTSTFLILLSSYLFILTKYEKMKLKNKINKKFLLRK